MKDLQVIGAECLKDMDAIGFSIKYPIDFVVSNRMTKTWGYCQTRKKGGEIIGITIKIAGFLLQDDVPIKQTRTTVLHELAHAYDENKHGHGKEWKRIADIISDCYNVDIQQYVTSEERNALMETEMYKAKQEQRKQGKYLVTCACGASWRYKRKTSWMRWYGYWTTTDTCRCPYCKQYGMFSVEEI